MSDDIQLIGPGAEGAGGGGSGRIQVRSSVLAEIDQHVESDTTVEQGGVLVGDLDPATGATVITARIPAVGAISEVASLRFTHETWDHINGVMERDHPDARMVGWYHSHPHFGIFLSEYDQFIHNNFFSQPWQVAYVVDPLLRQRGFFAWVDGNLVRVPSWKTWQTETGAADAPIGTPPPRPAAAPPAAAGGAPGAAAPAPGPDPHKVSPWSLGLLVFLVLALVGVVLFATNRPGDDDQPAFSLVPKGDNFVDKTATAGAVTPLGQVAIEGTTTEVAPEELSWAYHPTDETPSPSDAVIVSEAPNGGFDIAWRSTAIEDQNSSRSGELRVSLCDSDQTDDGCPEGDLKVASVPVSLSLVGPGDTVSIRRPQAFVTEGDTQPFVSDERLVELPVSQPLIDPLPDGVEVVGLVSSEFSNIYQMDIADVPEADRESLTVGAPLLPHLGVERDAGVASATPLTEDDLAEIGADHTDEGDKVPLVIVDTPERASRSRSVACGRDGVSLLCEPDDSATLDTGDSDVVSELDVIAAAQTVPANSVAGLFAGLPDGSCPTDPAGIAEAVDVLATVVQARPDVVWVVPATCPSSLGGALYPGDPIVAGNLVTVSANTDDSSADINLEPPSTDDESEPGSAAVDAAAIVLGGAVDTWSANRENEPIQVVACLLDSRDSEHALQVDKARADCGATENEEESTGATQGQD